VSIFCVTALLQSPHSFFINRKWARAFGQHVWIQQFVNGEKQSKWAGSKNKGQLGRELPFFRPDGERSTKSPGLGEVVAEGGEHHVVDALGGDGSAAGRHTSSAGPGILGKIRVRHAELHATLRTLVELVPEA
jgi:hypothetical protein